MAVASHSLLQRFVDHNDSQAFAELARRHGDMVYAVCMRILGNPDQAFDATQETFLQLLRSAQAITGSLSSWLHHVATSKAIDLARRESRQRQQLSNFAAAKGSAGQWRGVSLHIDEILEMMEPETKELLVSYFLENRSMTEIAQLQGVSQPTVSRKIRAATQRLRESLQGCGVVISAAALLNLLQENISQAAPTQVIRELGKMAMAGTAAVAAAGEKASVAAVKGMVLRMVKVILAVLIGGGAIVAVTRQTGGKKSAPGQWPPALSRRAERLGEMDLSGPQATLGTLVRLLNRGDLQAYRCFVPESTAIKMLQAIPPRDTGESAILRNTLKSIGPPIHILEHKILSPHRAAMRWTCAFAKPFSINDGEVEATWEQGEPCEFTAEVVLQEDQWRIAHINCLTVTQAGEKNNDLSE